MITTVTLTPVVVAGAVLLGLGVLVVYLTRRRD